MSVQAAVAAGVFDQGRRQGYLLPDQEFYDKYIRAEEQDIARTATQSAGSVGRGAKARGAQFAAAQGLGGTRIGASLQRQGAGINQQAMIEALRAARMRGEAFRRQKFAERDRQRAEAGQALATVGAIGTAVASAMPYGVGAVIGPISAAETAAWQAAYAATPELAAEEAGTRGEPLQTVDYGSMFVDSQRAPSRTRGGGGYDFYRNYGY